jgi:hypothetical protein
MKTLKLLGIAALSALLVFGVVACGDPEPKLLEGNDLTVTSFYGPYAGKEITAKWNGDPDDVDFEWFFNSASVKVTEENFISTYTPAAAGTVELKVTAEGYDPLTVTIIIEAAPAYVDYLGSWKMDYTKSENSAWKSNTTNGGEFNEYVTITAKHYIIKSDKPGTAAANEFLEFDIADADGWTAKSTASTVDNTFTNGFTLKGKITAQDGGYGTVGADITFAIYLKGTTQVSDRNSIKRYYEREQLTVNLK